MTKEALKTQIKKVPQNSGVYIFKKGKTSLYIGKAFNLKNRVNNYLRTEDERIQKMVSLANLLAYLPTMSDIEALILESTLIKKWRPKFNIMLRDDKQYFYVGISKEKFPRIFLTHQPTVSNQVRGDASGAPKGAASGFEHLGKRSGRTPSPSEADFVGPFTDGTALKTTLRFLRRIFPYCTCKQKHHNFCLNYHIHNCLGFCCLKNDIATEAQTKEYAENIRDIKEILEGKKTNLLKRFKKEMIALGKKEEFARAIKLKEKMESLERVFENARLIKNSCLENGEIEKADNKKLIAVRDTLGLANVPLRIEGYDISNIQGTNAAGSMVVFENGQPNKNEYRKFKIRSLPKSGDTGMLKEVLGRRFRHPEWRKPDLILIDGGKGQLSAAQKALQVAGVKIPVIALTKNDKHFGIKIFSGSKKETTLSNMPREIKNLILSVDAEAHRFAISYYRKLHKKALRLP